MRSPFRQRYTLVYDFTLEKNKPPIGFVWDDFLKTPVTNYLFYGRTEHSAGTEEDDFISTEDVYVYAEIGKDVDTRYRQYIIAENKAGINGENISLGEIEALYGADKFTRDG